MVSGCWCRIYLSWGTVQGTEIWLVSDLFDILSIIFSFLAQLTKDVVMCDFTVYRAPKIDGEPNRHLLTVVDD
jgi:hypothetical protein